jgi:alpha-1,2-mannosyltransferase
VTLAEAVLLPEAVVPEAEGRLDRLRSIVAAPRVLLAVVCVTAVVVRLRPLLIGAGLESYGRYDDGVYYSASDALTFGRLPYRDFVLLHPPGILLVLVPFAMLGRLTSDPVGMATARVAFIAIGALNAALVTMFARRWGGRSAVAAGLLYACWLPAVYSEQSTLLEPLGGTALLVALLLLVNTKEPPTPRAEVLAGVALGLACAMKIWYVAPWGVVILCLLAARKRSTALRLLVGGAAALALVLLPFFALAPTRMYDMVIRDQLLRPDAATSRITRLSSIVGLHTFLIGHRSGVIAATVVALALLGTSAAICWIDRRGRVVVAVLAGNLAVLIVSPSFFGHYAALTAAPAAIVVGIAAGKLAAPSWARVVGTVTFVVLLCAFVASGVRIASTPQGKVFPRSVLATAAPAGCVTSDDPGALIQMNRLSTDFRAGCRVAIDVTGADYDWLHRDYPDGKPVLRGDNDAFQQYLYDYLVSGNSFVIVRPKGDAISPAVWRAIARRPVLARSDGLFLRMGLGPTANPRRTLTLRHQDTKAW